MGLANKTYRLCETGYHLQYNIMAIIGVFRIIVARTSPTQKRSNRRGEEPYPGRPTRTQQYYV